MTPTDVYRASKNPSRKSSSSFELYDRSGLYAKEQAYMKDVSKSSTKANLTQEIDAGKINNFDGNNDDDNDEAYDNIFRSQTKTNNDVEGQQQQQQNMYPLTNEISVDEQLLKERRMKYLFMFLCFALLVTCTTLAIDRPSMAVNYYPYSDDKMKYTQYTPTYNSEYNNNYDPSTSSMYGTTTTSTTYNNNPPPDDNSGLFDHSTNMDETTTSQQDTLSNTLYPGDSTISTPNDHYYLNQNPLGNLPSSIYSDQSGTTPSSYESESTTQNYGYDAYAANDPTNLVQSENTTNTSLDQYNNDPNDSLDTQSTDASTISPPISTSPLENPSIPLEERFANFDLNIPYNPYSESAFFWHVPRTGGTELQEYLMVCHRLVGASQVGVINGHGYDESLQIITTENGEKYVNVDVTTYKGIERAIGMGFASSRMADVILSPRLDLASNLFSPPVANTKGKCFLMMRHPVERALSLFYYLQTATWEDTYDPKWKDMTIDEYAASPEAESNWMTRMITGKLSGSGLVMSDLERAKAFLKTKCLIGLTSDYEASLDKFDRYFGWKGRPDHELNECKRDILDSKLNSHIHETFEEGTYTWNIILNENVYDMMLYKYAVELYSNQII